MLRRATFLAVAGLIVPASAHAAGTAPTAGPGGDAAAAPARSSAPAPRTGASVAGGSLRLKAFKPLLYHKKPFGIIGRPMRVRARLSQYVPGQVIVFRAYRDGHRVLNKLAAVKPKGRRGVATAAFKTRRPGRVTFTAGHLATPQLPRLHAKPLRLHVHTWKVTFGSKGAVVDLVQRKLGKLHYRVFTSGTFDAATGRALLAYRKVNGRSRQEYLGRAVLGRLIREKGAFRAKYPGHGRHVEADLSRQVLALVNPKGHVFETLPISSGKPSTPTVLGSYRFYRKDLGVNSEGMVDSNYFIRGYAVHGYASVPTYPASHGCLRLAIADAYHIYSWIRLGQRIDVYP
jgi:L,D-transpeptidase-like protein